MPEVILRLPEGSWWVGGMVKQQFEERHVLFQNEDKATHARIHGKRQETIRSIPLKPHRHSIQ